MESTNNSAAAPARRGGVPVSKIDKSNEYDAKKMATRWRSRNLVLATRLELEQAREALLGYGILADSPYSAASSLLKRIDIVLAKPLS